MEDPFIERDISWLSFNHRVLQEARDHSVPLYERIKFLAIFSSNLDEFYRVRVSSLRSFKKLRRKHRQKLDFKPKKVLRQVHQIVEQQQAIFGIVYRDEIIPELADHGIYLIRNDQFQPWQLQFAIEYFKEHIAQYVQPVLLPSGSQAPFLRNRGLYFVVELGAEEEQIAILEIPTEQLDRFVVFPFNGEEAHYITFLDEIIRMNLPALFPDFPEASAFSIKLSRDAEMYIDDEYSGDLIEKIRVGLSQRNIGIPTRFLYDSAMPATLLERLKTLFQLSARDMIPGARYHNFNDFFSFPDPTDNPSLFDIPMPGLPHPVLEKAASQLDAIRKEDLLLHFPYQKFDYVTQLIWEAAKHPDVKSIKITLYRVANDSRITKALLFALEQGKEVVTFIEAKARFDEATNLYWGQQLSNAGANVIYSYPGIKVHTKLLLIEKMETGALINYAYVGTGNFNEKTARIYSDHALLTCDPRISDEVSQLFQLLEGRIIIPNCNNLLISPYTLRQRFTAMIDREIRYAKAGKEAYAILKMNSLEDQNMILKLYEASQAGVRIELIVRGICRLKAGVSGWSENIKAISIVDRYLEHARLYLFGNNGQEELYMASADWMTRNLDRRIEVAVPILDPTIFEELRKLLFLQLRDNQKARILDHLQNNNYVVTMPDDPPVRSQIAIYQYLKEQSAG
jgi:polyphosphate kinase